MTFTEWLEEVEVYSARIERFINDCDHHRVGSTGSNERMIEWLRTAYEVGRAHEAQKNLEDGGGTL